MYCTGNSKSSNNLGQLGRETSTNKKEVTRPGPVDAFNEIHLEAAKVFVSNSIQKDSGHSAILDKNGRLWMSGCDRWQQLGLGSANGGSAGYTWKGGNLWQDKFVLSESITTEIKKTEQMNNTNKITVNSDDGMKGNSSLVQMTTTTGPNIRDVALGGDHTLVLSSNKKDVFAFGKCGDGQCGFIGKPYVSAPKRSKLLSSTTSTVGKSGSSSDNDNNSSASYIAAVCAVESCSITLDDDGKVMRKVGKCTPPSKSASASSLLTSSALSDGIEKCIRNAKRRGLINQ